MGDAYWAAREGDALIHSSWLSDLVAVVSEYAVYAAVGVAVGALTATGVGALVVGAVVTVAIAASGGDDTISDGARSLGDALFPPEESAWIRTGSPDTHINGKPAARAAGNAPSADTESADEADWDAATAPEEPAFLDQAGALVGEVLAPPVASAAANTSPREGDKIECSKHPPQPEQYLAEGSSKVYINGQPAVRSGDRSTCDAKVGSDVKANKVSPNVRIGGAPVTVRDISSGMNKWIAAAGMLLALRKSLSRKLVRAAPCLAVNAGIHNAIVSQASNLVSTPVHAALGSKFLTCEQDLDIELPASFPITLAARLQQPRPTPMHTVWGGLERGIRD